MKIIFTHISDIHFKKSENPILKKVDQIVAAISSVYSSNNNISTNFILCSGDIAFSGKASEYKIAEKFFLNLKEKLTNISKPSIKIEFLFIPGNHDCNFLKDNNTRQILLEKLSTSSNAEWDESVIKSCLIVQSDYNGFLASWGNPPKLVKERIFNVSIFQIEKYIFEFHLFNSAALSKIKEQQGKLIFPENLIKEIEGISSLKASIVTTLIHHPYNWFDTNNARMLRNVIEKSSDVILTGHEHEFDSYTKSRKEEMTEYIEGGVLQDSAIDTSSFNIIVVDPEAKLKTIHHFNWSKTNKRYEEDQNPEPAHFIRNINRLKDEFILKNSFSNFLEDPGANFTHSGKEKLVLEDIFISPYIRLLQEPGEENEKSRLRDNIEKHVLETEHVLILGPEKSGKTTIAKMLFSELKTRGLVPVLISGEDIKRVDEKHIFQLIYKSFDSQYERPDTTSYKQISKDKRALIIDNFHNTRLNSKGRDKIVSILEEHAKIIVILGDIRLRLEDVIDEEIKNLHLWKYSICEVLPFGHLKRHDLVKKWFFIGRELTENVNGLNKKVRAAENLVSQLIGKNFAPSYPLFILAFLQQIEAQTPLKINSSSGSYGFLYESLLTIALIQSSKLKLDLDTQYTYLSEMAHFFFKSKLKYLSEQKISDWHTKYSQKYQRRLDFNEMLKNFIAAGVLFGHDNKISFRYPYLYYYFLGRYFRDRISEKTVRENIISMSRKLHNEEAANVLIFLSYLSKDPIIINSILESANNLFSSHNECDLIDDTAFLHDIAAEIPKLILDSRDSETRHREVLSQQDKLSKTDPIDEEDESIEIDSSTEDDELEEFLQINVALKTVQILGQIIRNYPGSLEGNEKLEIASSAYKLGLRVLKYMLDIIESNKQEIIELFVDLLRDKHPKWTEEKIKTQIGNMMFNIAEGLSVIIIKQISDSVGHESLSMTFDELSQNSKNISFKFININISMHHYKDFPEYEILDLYKHVRKNGFASQLVKHLVWYYLYIYPLPYNDVERICKKLGIQITPKTIQDPRPKLLEG